MDVVVDEDDDGDDFVGYDLIELNVLSNNPKHDCIQLFQKPLLGEIVD